MKTAKGGRKISLPWFRQTSVQQQHAALSRQHTIDTCQLRSYSGASKLQVNVNVASLFPATHQCHLMSAALCAIGIITRSQLPKLSSFIAWINLFSCHSFVADRLTQNVDGFPCLFLSTSAHVYFPPPFSFINCLFPKMTSLGFNFSLPPEFFFFLRHTFYIPSLSYGKTLRLDCVGGTSLACFHLELEREWNLLEKWLLSDPFKSIADLKSWNNKTW